MYRTIQVQDRKEKVTVSIEHGLAGVVDAYVQQHRDVSRSAVFEEALRLWYREKKKQQLREYYSSMTDEERQEDKEWCSLSSEAADKNW